jgi:hypothetical protein
VSRSFKFDEIQLSKSTEKDAKLTLNPTRLKLHHEIIGFGNAFFEQIAMWQACIAPSVQLFSFAGYTQNVFSPSKEHE